MRRKMNCDLALAKYDIGYTQLHAIHARSSHRHTIQREQCDVLRMVYGFAVTLVRKWEQRLCNIVNLWMASSLCCHLFSQFRTFVLFDAHAHCHTHPSCVSYIQRKQLSNCRQTLAHIFHIHTSPSSSDCTHTLSYTDHVQSISM